MKNMLFLVLILSIFCFGSVSYANNNEIQKLIETTKKLEAEDNLTSSQKVNQFILDAFFYCAFGKDKLSCEQKSYNVVGIFIRTISEKNANVSFIKVIGEACVIICNNPARYTEFTTNIFN